MVSQVITLLSNPVSLKVLLLVRIYINDLNIKSNNAILFADDTMLFTHGFSW